MSGDSSCGCDGGAESKAHNGTGEVDRPQASEAEKPRALSRNKGQASFRASGRLPPTLFLDLTGTTPSGGRALTRSLGSRPSAPGDPGRRGSSPPTASGAPLTSPPRDDVDGSSLRPKPAATSTGLGPLIGGVSAPAPSGDPSACTTRACGVDPRPGPTRSGVPKRTNAAMRSASARRHASRRTAAWALRSLGVTMIAERAAKNGLVDGFSQATLPGNVNSRQAARAYNSTGASEGDLCSGIHIYGSELAEVWEEVDLLISLYMLAHEIPNAQIAIIASDGRLVMAKGYTNCEVQPPDGRIFIDPTHQFRIGSVSKVLTAIATMQLLEGRWRGSRWMNIGSLDHYVAGFVDLRTTFDGSTWDSRAWSISVDHLLWHVGGWDREETAPLCSGIPGGIRDPDIANALHIALPVTDENWISYMNSVELSSTPGTCWSYSNYGYLLLGKVIESASGMSYESFVTTYILDEVGAHDTQMGETERRTANEVRYYSGEEWPTPEPGRGDDCDGSFARSYLSSEPYLRTYSFGDIENSVWEYPGHRDCMYKPYGGRHNLDVAQASGCWISNVLDLMRIFRELLPALQEDSLLLSADSIEMMFEPYHERRGLSEDAVVYMNETQAICWYVDGKTASKTGHISGAAALAQLYFGDRRLPGGTGTPGTSGGIPGIGDGVGPGPIKGAGAGGLVGGGPGALENIGDFGVPGAFDEGDGLATDTGPGRGGFALLVNREPLANPDAASSEGHLHDMLERAIARVTNWGDATQDLFVTMYTDAESVEGTPSEDTGAY